jgi:aspartate-semialdehyde dehydrogenase
MTGSLFDVAIVGATGEVGNAMLAVLAERAFPIRQLYPISSERSAGKTLSFNGKNLTIQALNQFDFSKVQFALFSAGASISAQYAPIAASKGCIVIDNTSHFRYEADIPLVVPEVNPESLAQYQNRYIIANPNCSTIQMVVALKPIYDSVGIRRINVATYQSVSGSGRRALSELKQQTEAILQNQKFSPAVYPHQIAFNVLPHIDTFQTNGYTKEEMKMVWETQKIFNDKNILVNPTAVRVPVFYGHSEAVHIETKKKISAQEAKQLLAQTPGVTVMDDVETLNYPTAAIHAAGKNDVFVGRIREDISHPTGLDLWIVSDNIRKGAALNAVQIAELMIKKYLCGETHASRSR